MGRWGGEEFLFILPNTTPNKALVALDRLRTALQHFSISTQVPSLRVAFSAGVAQHDAAVHVLRTLERADKALYQAKEQGRGRDVLAPPLATRT